MSWLTFSGVVAAVCVCANRADALLRKPERRVAYDFLLGWWYGIVQVSIPELPGFVFRGFNRWAASKGRSTTGAKLRLVLTSVTVSFLSLALGSYIQWANDSHRVFARADGWFHTSDY